MSRRGATAWHQQPVWLGILGLGLMLGGWRLSTFLPDSPGNAHLDELRQMAPDREYEKTLDRYVGNQRGEPPYRVPGRLGILLGLTMFISAGVLMYQAKPGPPPNEEPEPDEET